MRLAQCLSRISCSPPAARKATIPHAVASTRNRPRGNSEMPPSSRNRRDRFSRIIRLRETDPMGFTSLGGGLQRWEKYLNHFNASRPNDHDKHAGENKENERQEQFHRQFCSQLFRF